MKSPPIQCFTFPSSIWLLFPGTISIDTGKHFVIIRWKKGELLGVRSALARRVNENLLSAHDAEKGYAAVLRESVLRGYAVIGEGGRIR